ncbi:unnamed protein product [Aphanomyces euteiches]
MTVSSRNYSRRSHSDDSMALNNASIDYDNEINKLDPNLFGPERLSNRMRPLYYGRAIVLRVIADQCLYFALLVHKLRQAAGHSTTKIGILGGGSVGVEIAQTFLRACWPPNDLVISTRQPNDTRWMSRVDSAVPRYYDNVKLADESDVVILAMPPAQLTSVGIQVKPTLSSKRTVVVSVLAGVGCDRVSHVDAKASDELQFQVRKVCGSSYTLQTRMANQVDDCALEQFAHDNSSGLHALCLVFEAYASALGLSPGRQVAVDLVLGTHENQQPLDAPGEKVTAIAGAAAAAPSVWQDALVQAQRTFSRAINQLDVPT